MNRDDIIRMAREAGFEFNSLGGTYTSGKLDEHLERFAALVAALYTAPPQREPLTDGEICLEYQTLWPFHPHEEKRLAADIVRFARAIERAHGIGSEE